MTVTVASGLVDVDLSKYDLLVRIDQGFEALMREVAGAQAARVIPRDPWTWSLAAHLAHLAAWEEVELARTEGRSGARQAIGVIAQGVRRWRGRGPGTAAARNWMEAVHERLRAAVWDVPERRLRRIWHPAHPTTLAFDLARNTYGHYARHADVIRPQLSRDGA